MTAITREIHSSNAVSPNSTIIYRLPTRDVRYDALYINIVDQAYMTANGGNSYTQEDFEAKFGNVRVIADGVRLVDVPAKYFFRAKNFYGHRLHNDHLAINFFRPEMRDIVAERAYGLTTGDIANLTVEIDVKDFQSMKMTMLAMVEPDTRPLGKHFRILRHSYGTNLQEGWHTISDLPIVGSGKKLAALHFDQPQFFGIFKIKVNDRVYIDAPTGLASYENTMYARTMHAASRFPQTDYQMIDIACGRASDMLPLNVSSFQIELFVQQETAGFGIITEVLHEGLATI
jgi:hypothetical protein